ncbi:MAG TPA: hypothetical protein VHL52_12250 [Acidimicrobiia bacterium]|nr:hypothetical protein [Acidimicrobiia bacterium]
MVTLALGELGQRGRPGLHLRVDEASGLPEDNHCVAFVRRGWGGPADYSDRREDERHRKRNAE